MSDQTEKSLREGVIYCQEQIDHYIRRARSMNRRRWWELFWPGAYLVIMSIHFYLLHYCQAVMWALFALGTAALNWTANVRHLRWLRHAKRCWAARRAGFARRK